MFRSSVETHLEQKLPKSETIDLTMCRICYIEKGKVPIFHNSLQPNIPEEIYNFSGVSVSEFDVFPQNMCESCFKLLSGCIIFRDTYQKTSKELIEMAITTSIKTETISTENISHIEVNHINIDYEHDINSPSPKPEKQDVYVCATCDNIFTDSEDYDRHSKKCKKPSKPRKKRLVADTDKHPKKQRKRPPRKRRKVENPQKFLCDTCGITCSAQRSLQTHSLTHENIFPFKCDQCPYQGRTMELLRVHQRSHLTDKPYKCTKCPKSTTTASNLARHMANIHSAVKPFKCPICGSDFANQLTLNVHKKNNHLPVPVECHICYNKYHSRRTLRAHLIRVHKLKKEPHRRIPSYLIAQKGATPADEPEKEDC